jgi:hypothetical protein
MQPADLRRGPRSPAEAAAAPAAVTVGSRTRRRLLVAGVLVLVIALLVSTTSAPPAQAVTIGPIGLNPFGGLGGLLGGVTGGLAQVAVGAFDTIIKSLFAPVARFITTQLIGWLVTVPNLTQGNVAQLEQTVEAMAGGMLAAVATIATIRYWAAGFAGGGDSGFAALEGLTRTVGAALFLAVWPWLFATAVNLTNLFTSSLLGSGAVVYSVAHLLAAGLGAGIGLNFTSVGLFVNIAIAIAASLLFLGLLLVKIVVSISTILVFIGMPLAVVVWPVVPWIARIAVRAFAICLLVPVMWALCFAGAAAVSLNAISFNAGTVMNTLLQPLVAIVLLWVTLKLPVHLARVAMLGAAPLGGGFASRAVSYAAGSQMRDAVRGHLPGWAGGHTNEASGQPAQAQSGTAGRLRQAATLAGAAASGGTLAGATAGGGAASAPVIAGQAGASSSAGARAYTPPPTAQANTAGHSLQNGLQTPSFAGREQDFANEKFEAQYRERTSPVSAEQARAALAALPADTQRGVGQLVSEHGAGAREHLAYQAMGDWSPPEREALRTLAAASPDIRAQALSDTTAIRDQADPPPVGGVPGDGGAGERSRGAVPDAPSARPGGHGSPSVTPTGLDDGEQSSQPTSPPRDPGRGGQVPDGEEN